MISIKDNGCRNYLISNVKETAEKMEQEFLRDGAPKTIINFVASKEGMWEPADIRETIFTLSLKEDGIASWTWKWGHYIW